MSDITDYSPAVMRLKADREAMKTALRSIMENDIESAVDIVTVCLANPYIGQKMLTEKMVEVFESMAANIDEEQLHLSLVEKENE